jgi:Gpi18-like mannosyltransferase
MNKKNLKFLLTVFLSWRVLLFLFLALGFYFLPLQKNFLGGGRQIFLSNPWLWAWANFDGEHYLSIAQRGYGFGEQAFFPLYPLLMRVLSLPFGRDLFFLNWAGLIISNAALFLALWGLYKLLKIDYSEKITRFTIFFLLLFPTSFYFGSVYTESLFLSFVIWAFFFLRKKKWLLASILVTLASATRFIGILMLPVLVIEFWQQQEKISLAKVLSFLIAPLGLLFYMSYLQRTTGDSLAFIHTLSGFGEQRSTTPVILPQVFYRYVFKILPSISYSYFPVVYTTWLEFVVALLFLGLSIVSFLKTRLSYAFYLSAGYLIPTLSGSFSSLPRYVLVLFPAFIILASYLSKLPRILQMVIFGLSFISLGIACAMFSVGFWVS